MTDADPTCEYWHPSECEGTAHCPPRCPRFIDDDGEPWVVRPAGESDREALVEMYDDFAPSERAQGLPPRKRGRIEDWLDDLLAEGCNFVAASGRGVAGHAVYLPADDPEPEFAVFVHQDFQNRSVGTELSKHVVATAAAADREALTLVVDPDNRAARRLYDSLGFELVEELTFEQRGRGIGAVRMRHDLESTETVGYQHPPLVRSDVSPSARGPVESD